MYRGVLGFLTFLPSQLSFDRIGAMMSELSASTCGWSSRGTNVSQGLDVSEEWLELPMKAQALQYTWTRMLSSMCSHWSRRRRKIWSKRRGYISNRKVLLQHLRLNWNNIRLDILWLNAFGVVFYYTWSCSAAESIDGESTHSWLVVFRPTPLKWWSESHLGWFSIPNILESHKIPWFQSPPTRYHPILHFNKTTRQLDERRYMGLSEKIAYPIPSAA